MNFFTKRRLRNALLAAAALVLLIVALQWDELRLGRSAFTSGYILGGLVLILAGYNLRKKLPSLPLGNAATWLQVHCYLAIIAGGVFVWHAGLRWPTGWLEGTLSLAFIATFASGVWGLYITRAIPRQLSRLGTEVVFEQIPILRRLNANTARTVVLRAAGESGHATLADFFIERLYDYLGRRRSLAYLLVPTSTRRRQLFRELSQLERYLSHSERTASEQLFRLMRRKDDLDFQQARQGLLKWWLFAHLTLTAALLTLGTAHAIVALAWQGGGL